MHVARECDLPEYLAREEQFDLSVLLEETAARLGFAATRELWLPSAALIAQTGHEAEFLASIPALPQPSVSAPAGWLLVIADPLLVDVEEYRQQGVGVVMGLAEDIDAIWAKRRALLRAPLSGGMSDEQLLTVIEQLAAPARDKLYMGYSDAGSLLAALYRHGFRVAHGPMPADILRPGGEAAVARGLAYLIERAPSALEPHVVAGTKAVAFNLTILSQMLGTPIEPDLTDHVLMLEEDCEHMYRIDRYFFHITSNPAIRRVAGIRLGRCSNIPANVPDFAQTEEEVARTWCARAGIAYLGRADIGHDIDNKVVPFGDGYAV